MRRPARAEIRRQIQELLADAGPLPLGFAAALALFILYTHRSNIARLRAGTEGRFERVRIWRRLRRGAA